MPSIEAEFTTRADVDHAVPAVGTPTWSGPDQTWLRQVHGADVVIVERPGAHAGAEADAAVTDQPGARLVIRTADCVPILFEDTGGAVVGAAHAGWRGLVAGVIEATVDAMDGLGAGAVRARVGPHIRARCYEFGVDALDEVAGRYGEQVRSTTAWGTPALDLTAAVRAALADIPGVAGVDFEAGCTACEPDRFHSHRARADAGRQAATICLVRT